MKQKAAQKFQKIDRNFIIKHLIRKDEQILNMIKLQNPPDSYPSIRETSCKKILLINHNRVRCGVYQYGARVFRQIRQIQEYHFTEIECSDLSTLQPILQTGNFWAVIYNYHPFTMPFVTPLFIEHHPKEIHICLGHTMDTESLRKASPFFDCYILGDPTLDSKIAGVFSTGRLVEKYSAPPIAQDRLIIGSYGFVGHLKGFDQLVKTVIKELDTAEIRINIAPNDVIDADGSQARIFGNRLHALCEHKPGIELKLSYEFLSEAKLLQFLAGNTINVFPYQLPKLKGISSALDQALAVDRHIAVSFHPYFKHLYRLQPSVFVAWKWQDRIRAWLYRVQGKPSVSFTSIQAILENDKEHLRHLTQQWSPENLQRVYQDIFTKVAKIRSESGLNRILDDHARKLYHPVIMELFQLCPKTMKRRLARANIQQAFVFSVVQSWTTPSSKILCIALYEDAVCEALKKKGIALEEIDLETFLRNANALHDSYDSVFATAALESVQDDEKFLKQICHVLKPGGIAILTCAFKPDCQPGDLLFASNRRFYTESDLKQRWPSLLKGCCVLGVPNWRCSNPDFEHDGIKYTVATFVFQKNTHAL